MSCTPETSPPEVTLPQRFNLRDLGGIPAADGREIARGRLYRGASMHRLEPEHLEAMAPLGIRTAIDLRSTDDVGISTFAGDGTAIRHLPIFEVGPKFEDPIDDIPGTLADAYIWMLDVGAPSIKGAIELLGEPGELPALVYCAAGKDRTGVVCAIVLTLAGAERDAVAADFALSDAPAMALRAWHLDNGTSPDKLAAAGVFQAPTEAMHLFFDAVDERFGSLDGYLEGIGVDVDTARARLRDALLA